MNKLVGEKSPYLLQHKDNPVDWYPWGEEALEKAKREDKPLFISIGYSTCHWCHVMNRESFSDREVASTINDSFVPIKVDREERPDIDKVYMEFSQAMTGSGGWPLNLVATPEGKPLTVFTYLPKDTLGQNIGLIDYLDQVHGLWLDKKEELIKESELIYEEVEKISRYYKEGDIVETINEKAINSLEALFDEENGGFGTSPKFPIPQYLIYLLALGEQGNERALEMAETTLLSMYKGGIFDHIGYGFYRYSVDGKWLVPHFEKMLYDNVLLAISYTRAYEITGREIFKTIAEKIYEFILRDLQAENGGFFSALDADSEGVEGKYYLFTKDEIINLLGQEWGEEFTNIYDISEEGNFEGFNIPNLIGQDLESIDKKLESMVDMLQSYRTKRVMPHRDEKILTSWNGLAIASLSYGGRVLENKIYIKRAKEAADFVIENSLDEDYNLNGTHIAGESYNLGYLDDYSFFIYGMINLYEATSEKRYLSISEKLMEKVLERFKLEGEEGLYFSDERAEKLVLRLKDYYDGALPSGIAFILIDLIMLDRLTGKDQYREEFKNLIHSFGEDINTNPLAYLYSIIAYNNFL